MFVELVDGYVRDYVIVGCPMLDTWVEVDDISDVEFFIAHSGSYAVLNGKLVFDDVRDAELALEKQREEIRKRRENECFSVINRGDMWYDMLSEEQKAELRVWYQLWLDAPETLVIPEKPAWL